MKVAQNFAAGTMVQKNEARIKNVTSQRRFNQFFFPEKFCLPVKSVFRQIKKLMQEGKKQKEQ